MRHTVHRQPMFATLEFDKAMRIQAMRGDMVL